MEILYGASVEAPDLRGGAALVVAGLCAEGKTEIGGVEYIERGYECIESTLTSIGQTSRKFRVIRIFNCRRADFRPRQIT